MDFRDQALEAADYKCCKCGTDINEKTAMFNYIIPARNGGQASVDNLQVSCPKCELFKVENLLSSFTNPAVESAARLWIHSYLKSPMITLFISLLLTGAASFGFYQLSIYLESTSKTEQISVDFSGQLEQLDTTEESLKTLLKFVQSQKEITSLNEQRIQQLENEKARLEPLVKADKETVAALFGEQEVRASENASQERWLGFGLGIIASIIASFVMAIGNYFVRSRRKNS